MRIKSKTEIALEDAEALRIIDEYKYMDKLSFDGWMWEFIRRRPKYLNLLKDCEHDAKSTVGRDKYNLARSWKKKFQAIGLDVFFSEGEHRPEEYHIARVSKTSYLALPHPDKKYDNFTIKPSIFGSRMVQYLDYSAIKAWKHSTENDMSSVNELIQMMSPVKKADTLYIGISRIGRKKDILREVSLILDKYAVFRTNRRRIDKWKYYLMVFDLKTLHKKYDIISSILGKAYEDQKNLLDEANIIKYHVMARRLINLGEYRKHLFTRK